MSTTVLLVGSASAGLSMVGNAWVDDMSDISNFSGSLNMTVSLDFPGEVSMVSDAPSVDRLVNWMVDGTTRLDLIDNGYVEVTPDAQIVSGQWQMWALFYTDTGVFLDEVSLLDFTASASVFTTDLSDVAPVGTDEFFLRFRIKEAVGDGFSFSQIKVSPIPEPSSGLLALLGCGYLLRRNR
ncbi:MAG: hypothetical protein ACSHX6_00735 [Akkermansiaceae bacterium]